MADTAVFTLRLPSDLEAMIDICPGDTRTARIIGIIKFAFEQGYPGTEIPNHSPEEINSKLNQVDRLVERIKDIEENAKRWEFLFQSHHNKIDVIEQKLSRRISS